MCGGCLPQGTALERWVLFIPFLLIMKTGYKKRHIISRPTSQVVVELGLDPTSLSPKSALLSPTLTHIKAEGLKNKI